MLCYKGKEYSKINVVGTSGSGKTSFSRALSELTEIKHIEIDSIFWGPNWYWPPDEEFFSDLAKALEAKEWILDGNYSRSIPIKWKNAEMVIWLDYSFPRTLYQAIMRAAKRSVSKEELWPGTGNRESFKTSFFSKDSIILWTIKTHKNVKKKYLRYMDDEEYSFINFVRLRSRSDTAKFLRNIT